MSSIGHRYRLLRSALVEHWLLWAAVLVGILGVARLVFVVAAIPGSYWQADFEAYWDAAGRMAVGQSVFQPYQLEGTYSAHGFGQYLYTPVLAGLVLPIVLAWPSAMDVAGVVFAIGTFAFAASGLVAMARVEGLVRGPGGELLLVGLLWVSPPVLEAFITGNVELLQIGAFGWSWVAYRHQRSMLLGVSIGLLTLIKLQPALLFVWLLAARDRRAVVAGAATLVAFPLVLLPVTGTDDWLRFPLALSNMVAEANTPIPSPTSILSAVLPVSAARVVLLVLAAAFVWFVSTKRSVAAGYGAAIVAGFVLAPMVWTRYVSLEWIPLVLLWTRPQDRVWLAIAFVAGWGLSPAGVTSFGDQLWVAMQAANLLVLAAVFLRPDRTRVNPIPSMSPLAG